MSFIHVKNDSVNLLIISCHTRLHLMTEIEDEECYVANSKNHELTEINRFNFDRSEINRDKLCSDVFVNS